MAAGIVVGQTDQRSDPALRKGASTATNERSCQRDFERREFGKLPARPRPSASDEASSPFAVQWERVRAPRDIEGLERPLFLLRPS